MSPGVDALSLLGLHEMTQRVSAARLDILDRVAGGSDVLERLAAAPDSIRATCPEHGLVRFARRARYAWPDNVWYCERQDDPPRCTYVITWWMLQSSPDGGEPVTWLSAMQMLHRILDENREAFEAMTGSVVGVHPSEAR